MENDLVNSSSEVTIKNLKQQLKSNNSEYRISALHQLRKNNFPETNSLLKEIIKRDSEIFIRELALLILHEKKDPDIITFMRRIFFNINDNRCIRARAIWSLSQQNNIEAFELVRMAIEDKSEEVAYWAILGLLNHNQNETNLVKLTKMLSTNRSILIRQAITFYFGIIRDENSRIELEKRLLEDTQPIVRLQSAWALRNIKSIKSIKTLSKALHKEINDLTRREIALTIGGIIKEQTTDYKETIEYSSAKEEAIDCLTKVFERDSAYIVRRSCAESLGKIGDKRAVPSLLDKISIDTNQFVRREIILALGKIGDPQALDTLENTKKSNYRIIVQAVHKAILQIKNNQ